MPEQKIELEHGIMRFIHSKSVPFVAAVSLLGTSIGLGTEAFIAEEAVAQSDGDFRCKDGHKEYYTEDSNGVGRWAIYEYNHPGCTTAPTTPPTNPTPTSTVTETSILPTTTVKQTSTTSHTPRPTTPSTTSTLRRATTTEQPIVWVDSDGDYLSDNFELSIGTDPYNADTDGDGWIDSSQSETGITRLFYDRKFIDQSLHQLAAERLRDSNNDGIADVLDDSYPGIQINTQARIATGS